MMSTREIESVQDYCLSGYGDIAVLKAKIRNFVGRTECLPDDINGQVQSVHAEFYDLLDEIELHLEILRNAFPDNWLDLMEGIESKKDELLRKLHYWEFLHIVCAYTEWKPSAAIDESCGPQEEIPEGVIRR
jgi:hypothetical protein